LLDFEPLIAELRWGSEAIYGVATGGRQSEIEPMRCCTCRVAAWPKGFEI
jgi:hypothetical protein